MFIVFCSFGNLLIMLVSRLVFVRCVVCFVCVVLVLIVGVILLVSVLRCLMWVSVELSLL